MQSIGHVCSFILWLQFFNVYIEHFEDTGKSTTRIEDYFIFSCYGVINILKYVDWFSIVFLIRNFSFLFIFFKFEDIPY